jgi:hypothetical protein
MGKGRPFSDSAHQKTLKTAKTVQKVFDDFQNADLRYLCQSTDSMCGCVDLTDSNVISAPQSVKMRNIFQVFCRCAAH